MKMISGFLLEMYSMISESIALFSASTGMPLPLSLGPVTALKLT
jgi:hypothetical protein